MAHLDLELQSVLSDSIASAPLQTDANAADTPRGRIEDPEPICGRLPLGGGRRGLLRMCSGLEPGGRPLKPRPPLEKTRSRGGNNGRLWSFEIQMGRLDAPTC